MTRENKIKLLKIIVSCGFLFAVCYHLIFRIFFNLNYPFDTFLFRPEDRFNDFINLYNLVADPNAKNLLSGFASGYFQLLFSIPAFFAIFNLPSGLAVFLYLLVSSLAFILICGMSLKGRNNLDTIFNVTLCCLLSYPFIFTFDRANLEIIVFFILIYFIIFFQKQNYNLAAVCFGLAIAIKPFPIFFVALFLINKKFKELFLAALIFALASLISCYLRHETILLNTPEGLNAYQSIYAIGNEGLYFGNSLWGAVKGIGYTFSPKTTTAQTWAMLAPFYFYFTSLIYLILTIWLWIQRPAFWKQVAILVCAMNALPYISADYKLIHLFIPLFLFINEKIEEPLDKIYVFLFGFLLIPKAYGHIPGFNEASLSIIINPFLMISIVLLIVFSEYKKPRKPVGDLTANPVPAL